MYIEIKLGNTKYELILKIDFTSLRIIDKFIDLLKSNNVEVNGLGIGEYLIFL